MLRERVRKVHFIGIGGIGMSGIARVLIEMGYQITGSDLRDNSNVADLRELGARVFIGHRAENVDPSVDVVVYSSAVDHQNPEILKARQIGIPIITRGEMLAELFRLKEGIAVSGSHGKTTTTSMIASILENAGYDPTVIIGGKLQRVGGNAKLGRGDLLISEADESDGSFLKLSPIVAVVTNIDREHLDFYGSYEKLVESFSGFVDSVPFYGFSVVNGDDGGVREAVREIGKKVITCSVEGQGDVFARDLAPEKGRYGFTVFWGGKELGRINLPIGGRHNVYNALLSTAVALNLGIDFSTIRESLESFRNADRRMDFKGVVNGMPVFDDYGHHPTEMNCVISALREMYPSKRIALVFQPHRYSRTHLLFDDFVKVLNLPDKTYILEIFPAGEENIYGVRAADLALKSGADFIESEECLFEKIDSDLGGGWVLLFMGAGDIAGICERFVNRSGSLSENLEKKTT